MTTLNDEPNGPYAQQPKRVFYFIFCFWKIKKLKNDIFKPKIWWDKNFSSLKQEILFKYDGVNIILFSKFLWISKLI